MRSFDGPFVVTGHPHQCTNLLYLRNMQTGEDFPRPVNIEKIAVVRSPNPMICMFPKMRLFSRDTTNLADAVPSQNSPLVQVALEFALYLQRQPSKSAISTKACKFVYEKLSSSKRNFSSSWSLKGTHKLLLLFTIR